MGVSSWGWHLGVACDVLVESVSYHPHCSPSWGDGCLGVGGGGGGGGRSITRTEIEERELGGEGGRGGGEGGRKGEERGKKGGKTGGGRRKEEGRGKVREGGQRRTKVN